ncbi:MAG: hypothetical protein NTV28_14140 [Propionibacteriales bacterium]|nr:hypothetical protein [Propionibacteriales bacterium]
MAADFKALSKFDQGALVAGAVAIVFSFFDAFVTASVKSSGDFAVNSSAGRNAWYSFATVGILLVIVAVAVVAVKAFAAQNLPDGVPWRLVALATAALGTILLVLRPLTEGGDVPSGLSSVSVSVGPGWSGYIVWVAAIALTVFTALAFKDSGEKLPEVNKKSDPPAAS